MDIPEKDLEDCIRAILEDCVSVRPALERNEIAQHAIDHFSHDIRREVYASLERLVARGVVIQRLDDRDGRSLRYDLAPEVRGRH